MNLQTDLIRFSENGLEIATFAEIRRYYVEQFQNIYGRDIDVSIKSADGVYIHTISLMTNNMLKVIQGMYNNLDPSTASGKALERLCKLTNIYRKPATKSWVYVNLESLTPSTAYSNLALLDINGLIWYCDRFTSDGSGDATGVIARCSEVGPIRLDPGDLNQTVDTGDIIVTNPKKAIEGSYVEDDSSLRIRRGRQLSQSLTVLEGMIASLLNIYGVEDAHIYNNDTLGNITAKDGTSIAPHCLYVIIDRNPSVPVSDSTIGEVIYNQKTPGIGTVEYSEGILGTSKSYETSPNTVYWKEAERVAPPITVKIKKLSFFSTETSSLIVDSVVKYMNSLWISEDPDLDDLRAEAVEADPLYNSRKTFLIQSIEIEGGTENRDVRYYYDSNFTIAPSEEDVLIITIENEEV